MADILQKEEMEQYLKEKKLIVEPILEWEKQINPVGIDIRLDNYFGEFIKTTEPYVSPAKKTSELRFVEKEFFYDSFYLHPGEFVLAQSFEYISLPNDLIGFLNGKSSLGRRGLLIHATANIVDPGWKGHIVFELANLGSMPIELIPLMRIARIVFFKVEETQEYKGKFKGQIKIISPEPDETVTQIHLMSSEYKNKIFREIEQR